MQKYDSRWQVVVFAALWSSIAACGSSSDSGSTGGSATTGSSTGGSVGDSTGPDASASSSTGGTTGSGSAGSTGGSSTDSTGGTTGFGGFPGDAGFFFDANFTPVSCGDAQCFFGQVCDTANSKCVQCVADSDCFGGLSCKNNQCIRVCSMDTDCASDAAFNPTPACDTTTQTCVACVTNAQCTFGNFNTCKNNACVQGCTAEADCASDSGFGVNTHCDVTNQVCVACIEDSQCTFGSFTHCTTDHRCVQCTSNTDCTAPATCNTAFGICIQPADAGPVRPDGGFTRMDAATATDAAATQD